MHRMHRLVLMIWKQMSSSTLTWYHFEVFHLNIIKWSLLKFWQPYCSAPAHNVLDSGQSLPGRHHNCMEYSWFCHFSKRFVIFTQFQWKSFQSNDSSVSFWNRLRVFISIKELLFQQFRNKFIKTMPVSNLHFWYDRSFSNAQNW